MTFPFAVDKTSRESLTNQFVRSVKTAVRDGTLKVGDRLPSREEIARWYGCSLRVPREAFRLLKLDGYILTRPRLGSIVCRPTGERSWKGVVLLVRYDVEETSYHGVSLEAGLRQCLFAAGYLLLTVQVGQVTSNSFDFAAVERQLQFGISLAVVLCPNPYVRRWFERRNVPFMVMGGRPEIRGCCGDLGRWDCERALAAFFAQVRHQDIKTVLRVSFCQGGIMPDTVTAGIGDAVRSRLVIPPTKGQPRIDGIVTAAFGEFSRRLSRSRSWLPDLLWFDDDYTARGALMALMQAGVRVPEDVRVVSILNRGQERFFPKRLAGFLVDGRQRGRAFGEAVLEHLRLGRFVTVADCSVAYVAGETFPRK